MKLTENSLAIQLYVVLDKPPSYRPDGALVGHNRTHLPFRFGGDEWPLDPS